MNLTFADICLLVGTIGVHWRIGNYFYNKFCQAAQKKKSEKDD